MDRQLLSVILLILLEIIGIGVILFGVMYQANQVGITPPILIAIGSAIIAFAAGVFAKVYPGETLMGLLSRAPQLEGDDDSTQAQGGMTKIESDGAVFSVINPAQFHPPASSLETPDETLDIARALRTISQSTYWVSNRPIARQMTIEGLDARVASFVDANSYDVVTEIRQSIQENHAN